MSNTLATILDQDGNRALVEKYLETKLMERRDYDTVLMNSAYLDTFRIPDMSGQYVEASRRNFFRMPQKLPNNARTSDPASGASMGYQKVKLPMEYIQEFVPVGVVASWTSWDDLKDYAETDLVVALDRRRHQLTQNAFKVGRMTPGVWAADGTASTAFDASAQASPTIDGVSFTFNQATHYFVNQKPSFAALDVGDRHTMADYKRARVRMANSGAPKVKGKLISVISEAIQADLMEDDKYFRAAIHAFNGKGIVEGQIAEYDGLHWVIDDEPFTEDLGTANVRATNGQVHTGIVMGAHCANYVKLGSKSVPRPKFKVQDLSKTGVEYTIGYLVPFQVGVVRSDWCATVAGPVSNYQANE
jgi:hypothetical protein